MDSLAALYMERLRTNKTCSMRNVNNVTSLYKKEQFVPVCVSVLYDNTFITHSDFSCVLISFLELSHD